MVDNIRLGEEPDKLTGLFNDEISAMTWSEYHHKIMVQLLVNDRGLAEGLIKLIDFLLVQFQAKSSDSKGSDVL